MSEPGPDDRARFKRADALFDRALDVDTVERTQFVRDAAAGDVTLRDDVLALLRAHDHAGTFLEAPAAPDILGLRLQEVVGNAYQLTRRIAVGGMASVYLAVDQRHRRSVAIKVFEFPPTLTRHRAGEADRGGADRFLTEIRVMARLQHPGLLPLFDSGSANGLSYYVMPFVSGGTLRDLLRRESPLPESDALRIARAVAAALAHAHAAGVVHRDLKPENILLQDGHPLVADFGIALALGDPDGARVTRTGTIVGTPQYMSPEQATGEHQVDARTDVYSLAAVLYEMLVGDPPHVASTAQGVLAKVRAEQPTPVHVLRDAIAPALSGVLDRALAKRPADRYQSVAAFAAALAAAGSAASGSARWTRRAIVAMTVAVVAGLGGVAVRGALRSRGEVVRDPAAHAARFVVPPLPTAAIGRAPTITPDGMSLVYPGSAEAGRRIFVRRVSELQARALPSTEGTLSTSVSPDGKWIGFITADDRLWKTPIDGGTSTMLTGVFRFSSAVWAGNEHLILDGFGQGGLGWIPAAGGAVRPLTRYGRGMRESQHVRPFVLPDQRTVIFTIVRDRIGPGILAGELAAVRFDTSETAAEVMPLGVMARRAVGFVDGWLLYTSETGESLQAVRFDSVTRRTTGSPATVLEPGDGTIDFAALATNGTLLYTRTQTANAPVLVDFAGMAQPLLEGVYGEFMNPRFSPDGRRLLVQTTVAGGNDVMVFDIPTRTPSRVTSTGKAVGASWTPDGRHVVFLSTLDGRETFVQEAVDGSMPSRLLLASEGVFGVSVSRDNRRLIFQRMLGGTWGIWHANASGDSVPTAFLAERYDAFMPALSPDGRWLAYAANPTGRYEVYVRPFPGPGVAVQISEDGGGEPAWSHDGRQLYFRGDRRMYVARVSEGSSMVVTGRRVLFTDAFDGDMPMPHRNYDVARDGRHFVMIGAAPGAPPQTVVVLDWLRELRARLAGVSSARASPP